MAEPAPLVSIPQAPAPKRGGALWVEAKDGARLRAAVFEPLGASRGSVILSPGRTEPIEKYFEVIGELQERGFAVLAHDWRGQGLSERALPDRLFGHARGWRAFISDFGLLLETLAPRLPRPWIAMGHSMGGGLTALALAEGETRFAGAILSAPMLGVSTGSRSLASVERISFLMNLIGKSKALAPPGDHFPEKTFEDNSLTHDRTRWERTRAQLLAEPDLRLGAVTWGWLAFALILARRVAASRRIEALPIPLVIVAAEDERLVVNSAAKAAADRAPQGRYLEAPGAFHEILMETDARRAVFWTAFDALADEVAPHVKTGAKAAKPKTKAKPAKPPRAEARPTSR